MEEQIITIEVGDRSIKLKVGFEWTPGEAGQTTGPAEQCVPPEPEDIRILYAMDENQYVPQNLLKALEDDIIEGLQSLREAA